MRNKQNIKMIVYMMVPVLLAAVLALALLGVYRHRRNAPAAEPVVIAVPYSEWVQDYETNYYTAWLESRSGYDIRYVVEGLSHVALVNIERRIHSYFGKGYGLTIDSHEGEGATVTVTLPKKK